MSWNPFVVTTLKKELGIETTKYTLIRITKNYNAMYIP